MKWDIYKAKAWTLRTGMDHIRDGLYAEGGELVYEAKWGSACETEDDFKEMIAEVLCWDIDDIQNVVKEILQ